MLRTLATATRPYIEPDSTSVIGQRRSYAKKALVVSGPVMLSLGAKKHMSSIKHHRLAVLALASLMCSYAKAEQNACAKQVTSEQADQCIAEKLRAAEARLDSIYRIALAKLPEADPFDNRKTKAQLKEAQEAWQVYRDENCRYIGGLQGGSSRWVSIFARECDLSETERRIKFFNSLPGGG
jgi:uncharacterized protein YecT (DUF1311 family)